MIKLKLYSLARARHTLRLYTQRDAAVNPTVQWLNIGAAIYLLDNMPLLDERTLKVVISVPTDKFDSYSVSTADMPDNIRRLVAADGLYNGSMLKFEQLTINGYAVMSTDDFADEPTYYFVDNAYLVPLRDEEPVISYYIVQDNGNDYIVVMSGVFVRAVVLPVRFKDKQLPLVLSGVIKEIRRQVED